jgi:TetR/AcrR family transcriptional repressor of bet genes
MRPLRTSIEKIRRRDLIEAAYLTFLEHGFAGMTMARIGQRAGMSHGIINYYFKSKDELLGAVVRKANFVIMAETARRLRAAGTPRERVGAIVAANFPPELYTRDIARAWVSLYAAIGRHRDAGRMQAAVDRRLQSNLMHALRPLVPEPAALDIATGVAILIDGLWLRHAKSDDRMSAEAAVAHIERYVDHELERCAAPAEERTR